jgi:hypothetical protein
VRSVFQTKRKKERKIGGERSILLLTKRRRKGAECDLRRVKRRRTRIRPEGEHGKLGDDHCEMHSAKERIQSLHLH